MTFIQIYLILAFSFSLASFFFIHRKAFKQFKLRPTLGRDIAYIIVTFLMFPLSLSGWLANPDLYVETYGRTLKERLGK